MGKYTNEREKVENANFSNNEINEPRLGKTLVRVYQEQFFFSFFFLTKHLLARVKS